MKFLRFIWNDKNKFYPRVYTFQDFDKFDGIPGNLGGLMKIKFLTVFYVYVIPFNLNPSFIMKVYVVIISIFL